MSPAVSVARSSSSAVSSEVVTAQSSCWTPLPRVMEEVMPTMAHTWMAEAREECIEADAWGGASERLQGGTAGPQSAVALPYGAQMYYKRAAV